MRNETNLRKLADYLETLPNDYRDFGMTAFLLPRDGEATANYALNNGGVHTCGTAACAVGHGPSAGILFPPPDMTPDLWRKGGHVYPTGSANKAEWQSNILVPEWANYSYEFFISDDEAAWEWCFGGGWRHVDDHHWGAAARIRWLLAGNEPPTIDAYGEGNEDLFNADFADEDHVALYASFRKTA